MARPTSVPSCGDPRERLASFPEIRLLSLCPVPRFGGLGDPDQRGGSKPERRERTRDSIPLLMSESSLETGELTGKGAWWRWDSWRLCRKVSE